MMQAADFVSGGAKASRHGRWSLRDATSREATYYRGCTYANPPPCSTDSAPWLMAVVSHNRDVLRFRPTPIQCKVDVGTMAYGLYDSTLRKCGSTHTMSRCTTEETGQMYHSHGNTPSRNAARVRMDRKIRRSSCGHTVQISSKSPK
jgi:hypothetical protein